MDEDKRTYSFYRICVLSVMFLVALPSTCFLYRAVRMDCFKPVILLLMFTMCYILFFVFLTDVPTPTDKRIC